MKRFTSSIIVTSLFTLLSFFTVTYMSCETPAKDPFSCEGHVCVNGGYCSLGTCVCPTGYQGLTCATAWNAKFAGTWNVTEQVVSSDSTSSVGKVKTYTVKVTASPAPTSVVISNFENDAYFNAVVGVVDSSANFNTFTIQPFTPTNNGNTHVTGGMLTLDMASLGIMNGYYYTNYRNANGFVQHDTLSLNFGRQ